MNKKQFEARQQEDDIWCECEDETESYFVDNGQDKEIGKHHWRCEECDKVTQIG